MPSTLHVARHEDHAPLGSLLAHAFGFPAADAAGWFARAGMDNVLAARDAGGLYGGMLLVPMGQFFGGRSVPMIGLAGVGIAPERRGTGAGAAMMTESLGAMRARGAAISTLFPSTVPFYQRVGYERAGARFRFTLDPADLAHAGRNAPEEVRAEAQGLDPDADLVALQKRFAARHHGALDRGHYVWERVNRPWRADTRSFAIRRGSRVCGHVVVSHAMADHDSTLLVTDASAEDAGAARRIFALLGGYRSIATRVRWQLQVPGIFQALLPDRRPVVDLQDFWLVRVLDLEKALTARGYNAAVRAQVSLAYVDDTLPEASATVTLAVEGGSGAVNKGGTAAVSLGPRGMSALFSGFASATELALRGLLSGPQAEVEKLDAVFAGPMPTMNEMF